MHDECACMTNVVQYIITSPYL